MDFDHRPDRDDAARDQRDPVQDGQSAAPVGSQHGLFNSMLGTFARRRGAPSEHAAGEPPRDADEASAGYDAEPGLDPLPQEPQSMHSLETNDDVRIASPAKKPWWSMFQVKRSTDESNGPEDTPGRIPPDEPISIGEPPELGNEERLEEPSRAATEQYGADGQAEPGTGRAYLPTADGEPPKAGFLAKLKNLKEQLFPAAERPSVDDHSLAPEPIPEEAAPNVRSHEPPPVDSPDVPSQTPPFPPVVDELATDRPTELEPASLDQPRGQDSGPAKPGLFSKVAFWHKAAPRDAAVFAAPAEGTASASIADDEPVTTSPEEGGIRDAEPSKPVAAMAPVHPEPASAEETAAESESPKQKRNVRVMISPLFYIREFFIAAGERFAGLFAAIRPAAKAPLDEVVAGKLAEKQRLDREIKVRKNAAAGLARKLRRGRYERQAMLSSRSLARVELDKTLATLKARAADVAVLENQSMGLQSEIQQSASRHDQQLRDIDDGHLQWESLIQTIAQTKVKLDTVTTELSIKHTDSASLDRLMEEHRRELEAATAETARLEGVRKATEEALQEFRSQIARLDQDRIENEAYVRDTSKEVARIKKTFEDESHQRAVLEGVLAQLSQDVQVRQSLMQQLLDEGVRVKTETDQRMAQRDLLSSLIGDLTAEKEQLQQDATRFRDEARAAEETRRAASAAAERTAAELKRLEDECGERGRQVADLREKQEVHDLLSQKIGAMKDDGLALAKRLDELRNQKDLTEKALNSYRRELAAVDTDIAQRKEERRRQDQQATEAEEKIAAGKKDVELYQSQKSQLSDAIESAHRKLESLEEQIARSQEEHRQTDERLFQVRDAMSHAEEERQRLAEDVRSRSAELEDIAARHASFTQQLTSGKSEVEKLAAAGTELTAEIERNTKAKAGLIVQVQELKKIMAATAPQNDRLQQQRRELESWIREAVPFQQRQQSAIEGQVAQIKERQREMDALSADITQAEARLASLRDDLSHLDAEKAIRSQSVEDELAGLSQRLAQAQEAITEAERELQQRSEQRMGAIEAIQKLEEERDLLKGEVSSLSQQAERVKDLQAKADELAATMAAGQKRLEEMFQENQRLSGEKAGLQQAIKQVEAEHAESRDNQHRFAGEVQQIQNNLESLRQTREQLQTDLARQEDMLKSFAGENERSRQALVKQSEDAQNELDDRLRKLDSANDTLRQVESEISSKTISRDQLDETIARLKTQHADALAQVQAATGDIETQKKLVQQQLDSVTAEAEKAKRSFAELDKSVRDKAAEETTLLKRLKMLSTEAGQYQGMLKQWSELSRKIEDQKRVLEDLELQTEKKSGLFT